MQKHPAASKQQQFEHAFEKILIYKHPAKACPQVIPKQKKSQLRNVSSSKALVGQVTFRHSRRRSMSSVCSSSTATMPFDNEVSPVVQGATILVCQGSYLMVGLNLCYLCKLTNTCASYVNLYPT